MNSLNLDAHTVELRADGYLKNMNDWTPELAQRMALKEGVTLTEQHWDVLNIMREYYKEYNTSPILKLLRRELAKQYGKDRASIESLDMLFPYGVQKQGSRLAGVPLAHLDAELEQAERLQSLDSSNLSTKAKAVHYTDQFDFNGKSIKVYASGNLFNPDDWNEALAVKLAEKEGIELTDEHWKIIHFERSFYFKYGIAPMVKVLVKHMSEELGKEAANRDTMYKLFPAGPAMQGSRIAGLPLPQGCIDG
jgi:TusE/DsrC/DsvC family sulfur relay protein